MRRAILAVTVLLCAAEAFADQIDFGIWAGASSETPAFAWCNLLGGFEADAGDFSILGHLAVRTDGEYGGFMSGKYGFGGLTFEVADGGVVYTHGGFMASLGKLEVADAVDSPYSLFLSGRRNSVLSAAFRAEGSGFFYENRWLALSYDRSGTIELSGESGLQWPDRSADVKSWGWKLGSFRFAVQDAVVYTGMADILSGVKDTRGPLFDLDYFLLPIPSVFIQYIGFSVDSPWLKTERNDNSMIGFMVDWKEGDWYVVGQILIDDFNMNRFLNPSGRQNPDKIAWQLGARYRTEKFGTFGLFQAGATKYCFEPYGNSTENEMYGYTFSPDVSYEIDHTPMALEPEANYVGYLHGENNIALMGTWRYTFGRYRTYVVLGSLEFTLSGSKSPGNPWHEYLSWKDGSAGTKLLDENVLEKKVVACGSVAFPVGDFSFGFELKVGFVWNRLRLEAVVGAVDAINNIQIYRPSDESAPIGELIFGAKYHVPL